MTNRGVLVLVWQGINLYASEMESMPPNTTIPEQVLHVCQSLQQAGGKAWLVGGCVRDMLLGFTPYDWDIEVYQLSEQKLTQALKHLGRFEHVGKQFGVYKLWLKGIEIDIALPRKEIKTGEGHTAFDVVCDSELAPEQAVLRRDFTINAMMFDPLTDKLLDFHDGQKHLQAKRLKHVSPAFVEDPLRPLRAMQFAARLGLTLDAQTADMCKQLLSEAASLPAARIWQEWLKWSKAEHPSLGLQALKAMGWDAFYPELLALQGCPQDKHWHPEGDVWTHTMLVVDEARKLCDIRRLDERESMVLMFAALCHDLGKPLSTRTDNQGKISSPNHGAAGVKLGISFLQRIGAPRWLISHIKPLVAEHVAHFSGKATPRAVKRLAKRLEPSHIRMWEMLTEADANGRNPAPPSRPALAWLELAQEAGISEEKQTPIVTGKLLLSWGAEPSPAMGNLLMDAYEAQMDGLFTDEASAKQWYEKP